MKVRRKKERECQRAKRAVKKGKGTDESKKLRLYTHSAVNMGI